MQKLKIFSTGNTSAQFRIFLSSTLNQKYLQPHSCILLFPRMFKCFNYRQVSLHQGYVPEKRCTYQTQNSCLKQCISWSSGDRHPHPVQYMSIAYVNSLFTIFKLAAYVQFLFSTDCLSPFFFSWIALDEIHLQFSFMLVRKAKAVKEKIEVCYSIAKVISPHM